MFEQFRKEICRHVDFKDKELELIENGLCLRKVPKKYKLVEEGKICREIYFVNKGLMRLLYDKEGDEITAFIFKENLFASSYSSFLEQSPSIQILESLEETELIVLPYDYLMFLYENLPKMHILIRIVAEQRFINSQKVLASHLLKTPEERYWEFQLLHKDLLKRVPLHIIASYLGITPVSLSRIRNRTHKN